MDSSDFIPILNQLKETADNDPDVSAPMRYYISSLAEKNINKMNEVVKNLNRYENVAAITDAMTAVGNSLSGAAASMGESSQSAAGGSDYSAGSSLSGKESSKQSNNFNLSEQTSYNRDKLTYERYDSQLSSHFAGNQVMSASGVRKAQSEMKRIRTKWESRGKSFPHFANEDK